MIQKKICMLGAFAVGKTSLVARFVKSIFSEKYLTTVGVKIDKKVVSVGGQEMTLILWDLAGEDEFMQVRMSYLRGSSGYLLVADGTRRATLDKAVELQKRAEDEVGGVPFILLINKADMKNEWEMNDSDIAALAGKGWLVLETSAKTGANAEEAFLSIGEKMMSA
ncbi:MAG TPA: Rab family GTPase [Blastocatellia bacterium]|nr:Rab family GTPase [Blastocatellia bacterium]